LTFPASFVAYDIIYYENKEIIDLPLIERKRILSEVVIENPRIAVSRYIEEYGIELYNLTVEKELEGVVAKKKSSRYYYGKRSADWIKFKRMSDEEFIVCGYIIKKPMSVILLGKYNNDKLVYSGSVSFGVKLGFIREYDVKTISYSPFTIKSESKVEGETGAVTWLEPKLVCTIEYMPNTKGSLRQPVFKGIRDDIDPLTVQVKS
jgi:ATP-dependent DNA ligase